jgi:hypothetical protein
MLHKTPLFYQKVITKRLNVSFQSAYKYAEVHFGSSNLYMDWIKKNMTFLAQLIEEKDFSKLKRDSTG